MGGKGPSWVGDAVIYQIFPDRFRQSVQMETKFSSPLTPWGADPAVQGFQGGDLYGVIESLDHIEDIGITCLSLNPIFSSAANHRYHTYDYFQVDPLLGGNSALTALIEAVHLRGMRLILDGVFNHCGRGFWPFHHVVENGKLSPYHNWFVVEDWPLRPYPEAGEPCGYHCWWNDPALPKFNHSNPEVQQYLLSVGRYWLEAGIDGWRLDVPDEVPIAFWRTFRTMVEEVNPDAWIVGEIWNDATPWLSGDVFHGVMNYPILLPILGYFGAGSVRDNLKLTGNQEFYRALNRNEFEEQVIDTMARYMEEECCCQLNLLDGHDTPRALYALDGNMIALRAAFLFLFLLPGAPCIYYGTELGFAGGPEPSCREAMDWDAAPGQLANYLRQLADLRKEFPALHSGELRFLKSEHNDLLLVERGTEQQRLIIAINRGTTPIPLSDIRLPYQQAHLLSAQSAVILSSRKIREYTLSA